MFQYLQNKKKYAIVSRISENSLLYPNILTYVYRFLTSW